MYRLIPPTEIRNVWATVKPGLEHILRKSPENWIPEDIYASLVANRANLWLAIESDRMVGFVVGYVQGEDFHVWCAYGFLNGNLKRWFSELEDIARQQCTRITFDSWRPGWNRVAKELGFMPRKWAKEL